MNFNGQLNWNLLIELIYKHMGEIETITLMEFMKDSMQLKCRCFCHKIKTKDIIL